ncbi:MAG: ATP-grasp domain-containing protein [Eubacterium sp.]|nr:ATP-grasp domain-containing protein [Eubacterium sp.]
MKPILIYSEEEAKRNAFAAEKICAGLGAVLKTPDYDGEALYVINRTNDFRVGERFENRGVRVFNPSAFSRLANNKQDCYDFMEKNGIEIMPTRYAAPPFIKKPVDGHGGQGVKMCYDEAEYDRNFVCQKPASNLGKDLRVWVIGGEIIASVLRVSKTDFRSNFSLGGEAIPYALSDGEEKTVKKIISLVKGDYYGIDFVFNNGRAVFNELEDTVGARMVYAKTDIDILKLYCDYIKAETANSV